MSPKTMLGFFLLFPIMFCVYDPRSRNHQMYVLTIFDYIKLCIYAAAFHYMDFNLRQCMPREPAKWEKHL